MEAAPCLQIGFDALKCLCLEVKVGKGISLFLSLFFFLSLSLSFFLFFLSIFFFLSVSLSPVEPTFFLLNGPLKPSSNAAKNSS